jgi:hypothetical protein
MVPLRRLQVFGLVPALLAVLAIGGAVTASADGYGNHGGNVQLYQATASANCDNVSLCGADHLGGFWAWAVFNADGTVQGEITNCGHVTKAGASGFAGAQHFHIDGHYIITDLGPNNPWIVITDEVDTASGGFLGTGTVVNIPSEFIPVGPAAKAHLSLAQQFFGFSGPGVTFNVTVTPMHTS